MSSFTRAELMLAIGDVADAVEPLPPCTRRDGTVARLEAWLQRNAPRLWREMVWNRLLGEEQR